LPVHSICLDVSPLPTLGFPPLCDGCTDPGLPPKPATRPDN
jgi:hypothetical protein